MDKQLIGATPTMEMVKYRLICLAWLTKRWRIECQLHIDPSAYSRGDLTRRFYRARTVGHLGEARVYLTTLEKQLITQRFGSWQVGYLNWGLSQAEALGALLWAENQYPIFHDWLTPFPIKTCCQITTPLIMPFLPHVPLKLRRLSEIVLKYRQAHSYLLRAVISLSTEDEEVRWINETFSVERLVQRTLANGYVDHLVGGDLPVGDRPFAALSRQETFELYCIANGRWHGLGWLLGNEMEFGSLSSQGLATIV